MAGIDFPMERIYSMTVSGRPKTEVLALLEKKHPERKCLFIEDKVSTLYKVSFEIQLKLHMGAFEVLSCLEQCVSCFPECEKPAP